MNDTQAFAPFYKIAQPQASQTGTLFASVTVTTSSGGANASGVIPKRDGGGSQIRIANLTNQWAHINFGVFGDVTAATVAASMPVAPGAVEVVSVAPEVDGASVISAAAIASGSTSVIFTRGNGT